MSGREFLLVCVWVGVLHAIAFHDIADWGFVLDDWEWMRVGRDVGEDPLRSFHERVSGFFRPVVAWYWGAAAAVFGGGPLLHYVAAIATGSIVVVCVYLGLRTATSNVWIASLAALWFATHPAHVQVTAWLSARTSALLLLASWVVLLQARGRVGAPSGWLSKICALGAFVVALLTKEEAAILGILVVLPLFDREGIWRRVRRDWVLYSMMGLTLAAYLVGQWYIQSTSPLVRSGEFQFSWDTFRVHSMRMGLLLAPAGQAGLTGSGMGVLGVLLAIVLLPVVFAYRFYGAQIIWIVFAASVSLLPSSGFTTLWFASRYYYLGAALAALALVVSSSWYLRGWRQLALLTALGVGVLHNTVTSDVELGFWRHQACVGRALTEAADGPLGERIFDRIAAGQVVYVDTVLHIVVTHAYFDVVLGGLDRALVRPYTEAVGAGNFVVKLDVEARQWVFSR